MRDWQAVEQDNGVYCAPACGCGCLKVDYELCHQQAAALQAELKAAGYGEWEIRVWENGGWHWELRHKFWHLSPNMLTRAEHPNGHPERRYAVNWSCYTLEGPQGVSQIWQRGFTPLSAIANAAAALTALRAAVHETCAAFPAGTK